MTGRRRTPTSAELTLWRQVVADAKPVRRRRRSEPKPGTDQTETATAAPPSAPAAPAPSPAPLPGPAPRPRLNRRAPVASTAPPADDLPLRARPVVTVDRAPALLGAKTGLDKRTEERVRRGQLPIDGRIDLHGMTQDRAHDALLTFVRGAHASGRRLLLVITGKGQVAEDRSHSGRGVLRSAVPRWLNEPAFRPLVLAVHQAQPHHGGSGALYVFLKRVRG